jgi:hypothetical protein
VRCWVCGATADGACRFCGRGVCKTHARTQAFLFAAWPTKAGLRGLGVEDALWCGVCHLRSDPVPLDFLDSQEP